MRILIAEDNTTSRQLLRRILEMDPENQVEATEDGLAAWQRIEQGYWQGYRPDLCLFDIVMPKMDGFELVRRIRGDTRFREIPVVLCSALKDRASIAQAAELSVQYFITKPYSIKTVTAQLQKAKAAFGRCTALVDPRETCARLGIDMATYINLASSLVRDVDQTIQVLCSSLGPGKLAAAEMKIDSLRGAAADLGAEGLRRAAEAVQKSLKIEGTPWERMSSDGGVDPAATFEEWLRNHRPFILEGYARLRQEGSRLNEALAKLRGGGACENPLNTPNVATPDRCLATTFAS